MNKKGNKLDVVEYLCDYLPDLVFVNHKGCKVPFRLAIEKNGSKGLSLVYKYYPTFLLEEDVMKIRKMDGKDGVFWWGIRNKFNAPMECIYLCEYIRSSADLQLALRRCYKFLRKSKLIGRREQNVRKKSKLLRVIDSNSIT